MAALGCCAMPRRSSWGPLSMRSNVVVPQSLPMSSFGNVTPQAFVYPYVDDMPHINQRQGFATLDVSLLLATDGAVRTPQQASKPLQEVDSLMCSNCLPQPASRYDAMQSCAIALHHNVAVWVLWSPVVSCKFVSLLTAAEGTRIPQFTFTSVPEKVGAGVTAGCLAMYVHVGPGPHTLRVNCAKPTDTTQGLVQCC